jgi:hypothetical protein
MKRIAIIITTMLLLGCSEESGFTQTKCEYMDDTYLMLGFVSNTASRTISISKNHFTFKGTTLDDMKWRVAFTDMQSVQFTEQSELKVTLKSGFAKVIGKVDSACKVLLKERLSKLIVKG